MIHEFDAKKILLSVLGYKGLPFPGAFIPSKETLDTREAFDYKGGSREVKTLSDKGSLLRRKDLQGRWYFMPVVFSHKGKDYEIPNAVVSVTGKKNIVETSMVGRKGTVKELISLDDYEITIAGVVTDTDFPESGLSTLNELYNINEAVTLKCALTDIFLEEEDNVVIKSVNFSETRGMESAQLFTISLLTDRSFELIIE